MANIEAVWGVEERAKLNRTIDNPVRLTAIDECFEARERIIALQAEIAALKAQAAVPLAPATACSCSLSK